MKKKPPGANRPDPVLHRVRIEFGKDGPARFLAHLDLQVAFERALRRARLPLAFSRGFHPRPRMVFEEALPLGWSSECESCWLDLLEAYPCREIHQRLTRTLPAGFTLKRVYPAPGKPSMPRRRSFRVEHRGGAWPDDLSDRVEQTWPTEDQAAPAVRVVENGAPAGRRFDLVAPAAPSMKKVLRTLLGDEALPDLRIRRVPPPEEA